MCSSADKLGQITLSADLGNLAVGLGTVLVAFVTLWVSLKSIRGSRVQKIAEFRKEWIENLRVHFAEFQSTAVHVSALQKIIAALEKANQQEKAERFEIEFGDRLIRLKYLHSYIKLMLNPTEKTHAELISLVDSISENITSETPDEIEGDFDALARTVLKAEWNRVRQEP